MSATMKLVRDGIKRRDIEAKVGTARDDIGYTQVNVELYTEEIVRAFQASIGKDKMPDSYVELYLFAYDAMMHLLPIQTVQLSGVLLTHKKIVKWLKGHNVISITDLQNPAVADAFIRFHMKQRADSDEVLNIVLNSMLRGEL